MDTDTKVKNSINGVLVALSFLLLGFVFGLLSSGDNAKLSRTIKLQGQEINRLKEYCPVPLLYTN